MEEIRRRNARLIHIEGPHDPLRFWVGYVIKRFVNGAMITWDVCVEGRGRFVCGKGRYRKEGVVVDHELLGGLVVERGVKGIGGGLTGGEWRIWLVYLHIEGDVMRGWYSRKLR